MATRRPKVPRAHFADGAASREPDATPHGFTPPAGSAAFAAVPERSGPAVPGGPGAGGDTEPAAAEAADHGATAAPEASAGAGRMQTAAAGARNLAASGWARARGTRGASGSGAGRGTGRNTAAGGKSGTGHASRGGASAPEPELKPIPAKAFSGRLLALAVVLLTITLLLAPSVRTFLEQRSEITALQQDIDGKKQQQTDLKTELSRWSDPAYVKQQARDRVNMMMPGETGYWVYGGDGTSAAPQKSGAADGAANANPEDLPWVDGLWQSIQRSANQ